MRFDGKAFGQEIVSVVKEYVSDTLAPLLVRLDAVEKRQPEKGERGEKGDQGDPGKDGAAGERGPQGEPGETGPAGEAGPAGAPGKDGSAGEPGPQGEPGEKGDPGDPGNPGPVGEPGKDGAPGVDGKDGVGVAGAVIDRFGNLVLTLSDGTTRDLGAVIGKDGSDGAKGDPGQDGKDGADGFGFEDLEVIHDGLRGFTFRFTKGDRVKEFPFTVPVVLDRGVFKSDEAYAAGDGVTWGGSFWIAQKETTDKPGDGDGWRLAVKKGRDGKDGVLKAEKAKEPLRVG